MEHTRRISATSRRVLGMHQISMSQERLSSRIYAVLALAMSVSHNLSLHLLPQLFGSLASSSPPISCACTTPPSGEHLPTSSYSRTASAKPMLILSGTGGPTSAVIAFQNPSIHVNVVDRDPARIARWNSQHLPIHEDGLTDIVRIARDGSNACSFYNTPAKFDDACLGLGRELGDEISILARKPNLFFSTDVAKCIAVADIILITVNTPTKIRGMGAGAATDMSALESATREIAIHAKPGAILVEKSTVPSGTSSLIQEIVSRVKPCQYYY
jgi:hypothetical protein